MLKATKAAAHYRDHTDDGKPCANCTMFVRPDKCTYVLGRISPGGHCDYFKPAKAKLRVNISDAIARAWGD